MTSIGTSWFAGNRALPLSEDFTHLRGESTQQLLFDLCDALDASQSFTQPPVFEPEICTMAFALLLDSVPKNLSTEVPTMSFAYGQLRPG